MKLEIPIVVLMLFRVAKMGCFRPSVTTTNSFKMVVRTGWVSTHVDEKLPKVIANAKMQLKVPFRGPETKQMFRLITRRDFEGAMKVYDNMKEAGIERMGSELYALLSVCSKAEHLDRVLEIVHELESAGHVHVETSYLALIRCYAANGQVDKAVQLIQETVDFGIEPRQRIFQPLLDSPVIAGNLTRTLEIIAYMRSLNVRLRGQQLTSLLSTLGDPNTRKELRENPKVKAELDMVLTESCDELLGLSTLNMQEIVMAVNNISAAAFIDQGVLVDSLADIRSTIISTQNMGIDGSVTALNASFERGYGLLDEDVPLPNNNDPALPIGQDETSVQLIHEKYVVLSERLKLLQAQYKNNHTEASSNSSSNNIINATESLTSTSTSGNNNEYSTNATTSLSSAGISSAALSNFYQSEKFKTARVVEISSSTCKCPNCDGEMLPLLLNDEEKSNIRSAILDVARAKDIGQERNMKVCYCVIFYNDTPVRIL